MLRFFRYIALAEGITTLALFCIAMPLKYALGVPELVRPTGWVHGMAWLAYLAGMALCLPGKRLTVWQWARTFLVSLFPFGTFLNDPMLKRKEQERRRSGLEALQG
jgi:integral membrane protein